MAYFLYPWLAEDGRTWVFIWDGGKQIKVALAGRAPHDEIDVWDAANDRSSVPVTYEGMATAIKAWLAGRRAWLAARGLSGEVTTGRSATTPPPLPSGGRGDAVGLGS
jgi:hypothetical protein